MQVAVAPGLVSTPFARIDQDDGELAVEAAATMLRVLLVARCVGDDVLAGAGRSSGRPRRW